MPQGHAGAAPQAAGAVTRATGLMVSKTFMERCAAVTRLPAAPAFATIERATNPVESLMTPDERAALDGRLLAIEFMVQALFTIITQHLPTGPAAVRHALDSILLALEQTRALGSPQAKTMIDAARVSAEHMHKELAKLPAMQSPAPETPDR